MMRSGARDERARIPISAGSECQPADIGAGQGVSEDAGFERSSTGSGTVAGTSSTNTPPQAPPCRWCGRVHFFLVVPQVNLDSWFLNLDLDSCSNKLARKHTLILGK